MTQQALEPAAAGRVELEAIILQGALTLGIACLTLMLWRRHGKAYFGWFALSWFLYVARLAAVAIFLLTSDFFWLFWHQVLTGWMALSLMWAALVFSRRVRLRPASLSVLAFPLFWSYVAIYQLDSFILAALPAVAFLSLATIGTGWAFLRHWRSNRAAGGLALAVSLFLWGLHHLDYPFLRARGTWVPWGYYLDILFVAAVGAGILLLTLDSRTAELEALQRSMVRQREEERRRISLHLHDETAQVLSAAKLQLGMIEERSGSEVREPLAHLRALLDDGLSGLRNITNDLRPSVLDDLGLLPALRSLAVEFEARTGLVVRTQIPDALPRLLPDAELALFRALQESLSNVAEHAQASWVQVSLTAPDGAVRLEVRDDGRGLPANAEIQGLERAGHLGLVGMRERIMALGGVFDVTNAEGGGTRIRATIPVAAA